MAKDQYVSNGYQLVSEGTIPSTTKGEYSRYESPVVKTQPGGELKRETGTSFDGGEYATARFQDNYNRAKGVLREQGVWGQIAPLSKVADNQPTALQKFSQEANEQFSNEAKQIKTDSREPLQKSTDGGRQL